MFAIFKLNLTALALGLQSMRPGYLAADRSLDMTAWRVNELPSW